MTQGLQTRLGHHFSDERLLAEALTHRSFGTPHNERLEFIGDSVLNCVIAHALFLQFPALSEGELSRLRANLVSREPLTVIASFLGLGECLRLGEGELRSGGRERASILADTTEALFGAILRDAGFAAAQQVILNLYAKELRTLNPSVSSKDAKTELQEWLQARKLPRPIYDVREIRGAQHNQTFEVRCLIEAKSVDVVGEGVTRRAAEQVAAATALARLTAAPNKKASV